MIGVGGQPWSISSTDNMIVAEQCRQPVQLRCRRGFGPTVSNAWRTAPLRQPVRIIQCPPACSASSSRSYSGPALLVAAQLGFGDGPGQPVISLDPPGEHQQVLTLGVGYAVLRGGQSKRELGAVDSAQVVRQRRLGEA